MTKAEALENQFEEVLEAFGAALSRPKDEFMRDSCILRFELTFDLAWKALKEYLEVKKGISKNSPKDCFREAYRTGIIEYEDIWMKIVDARNEAVHIYKRALAEALYAKLPKFLEIFKELQKALKK